MNKTLTHWNRIEWKNQFSLNIRNGWTNEPRDKSECETETRNKNKKLCNIKSFLVHQRQFHSNLYFQLNVAMKMKKKIFSETRVYFIDTLSAAINREQKRHKNNNNNEPAGQIFISSCIRYIFHFQSPIIKYCVILFSLKKKKKKAMKEKILIEFAKRREFS